MVYDNGLHTISLWCVRIQRWYSYTYIYIYNYITYIHVLVYNSVIIMGTYGEQWLIIVDDGIMMVDNGWSGENMNTLVNWLIGWLLTWLVNCQQPLRISF